MDRSTTATPAAVERTAALLERGYRLALVLQEGLEAHATPDGSRGFAQRVVAMELVNLLDEARAALVRDARRA